MKEGRGKRRIAYKTGTMPKNGIFLGYNCLKSLPRIGKIDIKGSVGGAGVEMHNIYPCINTYMHY